MKEWIVIKFGGTSIGSVVKIQKAVEIVKKVIKDGDLPIVVLSAASLLNKKEGTTSRLLKACQLAVYCDDFEQLINQLKSEHEEIINNLHLPTDRLNKLQNLINSEFDRIFTFLRASLTIEEMSVRIRDLVIASGERLICLIFSAYLDYVLNQSQIDVKQSVFVNLDDIYLKKDISTLQIDQQFYEDLRSKIADRVLKLCFNGSFKVPVLTGFIGLIPHGLIETIGRGYTDFTAAMCAAGLKSLFLMGSSEKSYYNVREVQIRKEVPGIFTADPTSVPSAKILTHLRPEEVAELTYYGSEVIHPFTMEQVIRMSIPIRILGCAVDDIGTCIIPDEQSIISPQQSPGRKLATATTLKQNITVLNIKSNKKTHSHGFLAQVFNILDSHGIVVDLISTSEVNVSMAISNVSNGFVSPKSSPATSKRSSAVQDSQPTPNTLNQISFKLAELLKDLKKHGTPTLVSNQCILSLIGYQMKNARGTASLMFTTLAKLGVNIEIISQGASEVNISCVIGGDNAKTALYGVHETCVLGKDLDETLKEVLK